MNKNKTKDNLRLNDINARLLSLEKKLNKLIYSIEYLTEKVNEIHNETFSTYEDTLSSLSNINTSPIFSPKKRINSFSPTEQIKNRHEPIIRAVPSLPNRRKITLPTINTKQPNNDYVRSESS